MILPPRHRGPVDDDEPVRIIIYTVLAVLFGFALLLGATQLLLLALGMSWADLEVKRPMLVSDSAPYPRVYGCGYPETQAPPMVLYLVPEPEAHPLYILHWTRLDTPEARPTYLSKAHATEHSVITNARLDLVSLPPRTQQILAEFYHGNPKRGVHAAY